MIRAVEDHGAGAFLVIEAKPERLVPFTRAVVPVIDLRPAASSWCCRTRSWCRRSRARMTRHDCSIPWHASVLTLFPEMFPGPLGQSLAGKALREGRWALDAVDIRGFATDRHRSVDDTPFGGGAAWCCGRTWSMRPAPRRWRRPGRPLVVLTPRGRPLDQAMVRGFAGGPGVVLLCGRFEGIDQRVIEARGHRGGLDRRLRAVRRRAGGAGAAGCLRAAAARA